MLFRSVTVPHIMGELMGTAVLFCSAACARHTHRREEGEEQKAAMEGGGGLEDGPRVLLQLENAGNQMEETRGSRRIVAAAVVLCFVYRNYHRKPGNMYASVDVDVGVDVDILMCDEVMWICAYSVVYSSCLFREKS